ncbi:hypothetical protein EDD16DRAFT_1657879 [Pisolithus croceorrhizus]|nr:hypothetical protein EDD16DRAFT_1657879 [Pisolithus croceorrhizus]KAI6166526.1 hypothetical protein EDD17DRAFT_1543840 [Pisolithus thermaeus]
MSKYTEILHFTVVEDLKAGTVTLDGIRDLLFKAEGLKRSYAGPTIEDPAVLYIINEWASKDAYAAFLNSPSGTAYEPALQVLSGSPLIRFFVEFDEDESALSAPIVEYATFTLKEDDTAERLKALLHELIDEFKAAKTSKYYGSGWGEVLDKPNVYQSILGWDSIEAHQYAVQQLPAREIIGKIMEQQFASLEVVHLALKPVVENA